MKPARHRRALSLPGRCPCVVFNTRGRRIRSGRCHPLKSTSGNVSSAGGGYPRVSQRRCLLSRSEPGLQGGRSGYGLRAMVRGVKSIRREFWPIILVLLQLFVAPCAMAMVAMPADANCEHCGTMASPDSCAVASPTTNSMVEGPAFGSGRADVPYRVAKFSSLLTPELTRPASQALFAAHWSRSVATRRSGDPPLYLLLSQLRI